MRATCKTTNPVSLICAYITLRIIWSSVLASIQSQSYTNLELSA